ncbi:adenylyltransferase/cytidyltransferase family protein [Brevundimonas sp.]|uniref:adenylyltransferase/cytidyltransferase family protein n=1 Tax=Brevundimonas sp. TaxID=1871086 RepID=UPI003BAB08D9
MIRVVTFGTFDLFHVGHLRILERARAMGDHLSVGVSSDALNFAKKQAAPAITEGARLDIVRALRCVDEVFVEHDLALKRQYLIQRRADILVMGDDWSGHFDHLGDICRVVYLPRTGGISTTALKDLLRDGSSIIVTGR